MQNGYVESFNGKMRDEFEEAVPAEYNTKSTLKVDVKHGEPVDLDLKTAK